MWRLMLFAVTKQQQAKPLGTFLPPLFLPDNRTYAFSETSWVKQLNVLYGFHMFGLLKDFWVQMQALQSRLAWSTLGAGGESVTILIDYSLPRANDRFIWVNWRIKARSQQYKWRSAEYTGGQRLIPATDCAISAIL